MTLWNYYNSQCRESRKITWQTENTKCFLLYWLVNTSRGLCSVLRINSHSKDGIQQNPALKPQEGFQGRDFFPLKYMTLLIFYGNLCGWKYLSNSWMRAALHETGDMRLGLFWKIYGQSMFRIRAKLWDVWCLNKQQRFMFYKSADITKAKKKDMSKREKHIVLYQLLVSKTHFK